MAEQRIVVTGAAGLLGSAIVVDLARQHRVEAIDRRGPDRRLVDAAPSAVWHRVDIGDGSSLHHVARDVRRRLGDVDIVIHLAAYYHFGDDWRTQYDATNVRGTEHVVHFAIETGARRLIFASSTMATLPPARGGRLTEDAPADARFPYGRSKAMGEQIVREHAHRLPATVLRIGGVFTDWCELPPLYGLIRLWRGPWPMRRVVVGQGGSGIPYLHRSDLVRLVRRCVERHGQFDGYEQLLAASDGALLDRDLFALVARPPRRGDAPAPWHLPTPCARLGLRLKRVIGRLMGQVPLEQPWMLDYVDRPWHTDTTHTRRTLGWQCRPAFTLAVRMPTILEHFEADRAAWELRNRRRNRGQYTFLADQA